MAAYKPGYRTSEFWFTLVSFLFSGLYLVGIIGDPDQKEELITAISHGVESVILIGGQVLILYKYINGRNSVKDNQSKQTEIENEQQAKRPARKRSPAKSSKSTKSTKSRSTKRKPASTTNKSGTNTTRSRKNNTKNGTKSTSNKENSGS